MSQLPSNVTSSIKPLQLELISHHFCLYSVCYFYYSIVLHNMGVLGPEYIDMFSLWERKSALLQEFTNFNPNKKEIFLDHLG